MRNCFQLLGEEEEPNAKYGRFVAANVEATRMCVPVMEGIRISPRFKHPEVKVARGKVEDARRNFDHVWTTENREALNEAKQLLFNAYDKIKGEELMEKVQRVEAAQGEQQHGEAWRVINEMSGRKRSKEGQVAGHSPEERVITWFTHFQNLLGTHLTALREFHYEVGYRNTSSTGGFDFEPWVNPTKEYDPFDIASHSIKSFALHEGLHSFEQLSRFFFEAVPGITLKFNNSNLAELDAPEHIGRIRLSGSLSQILEVDKKGWIRGKYEGDQPVKIIVHKWFYIYLDQLSTTSNLIDGAPSTLLAIVPAATSDGIIDITPSNPMYKKLEVGNIHQLNLRVLDENGTIVRNRRRPITAVLEIRENA